jgi:hypothetical protein
LIRVQTQKSLDAVIYSWKVGSFWITQLDNIY